MESSRDQRRSQGVAPTDRKDLQKKLSPFLLSKSLTGGLRTAPLSGQVGDVNRIQTFHLPVILPHP